MWVKQTRRQIVSMSKNHIWLRMQATGHLKGKIMKSAQDRTSKWWQVGS